MTSTPIIAILLLLGWAVIGGLLGYLLHIGLVYLGRAEPRDMEFWMFFGALPVSPLLLVCWLSAQLINWAVPSIRQLLPAMRRASIAAKNRRLSLLKC